MFNISNIKLISERDILCIVILYFEPSCRIYIPH